MVQILMGTALLLVVLALFTLFSYKAPQGMKAMGALANAACASFLVEAFHDSLFGTQMGVEFLKGKRFVRRSCSSYISSFSVRCISSICCISWFNSFWIRYTSWIYSRILSIIRYKILRKESSSWFRLNSYNISCCSIN